MSDFDGMSFTSKPDLDADSSDDNFEFGDNQIEMTRKGEEEDSVDAEKFEKMVKENMEDDPNQ
jgi:hypothetical protein